MPILYPPDTAISKYFPDKPGTQLGSDRQDMPLHEIARNFFLRRHEGIDGEAGFHMPDMNRPMGLAESLILPDVLPQLFREDPLNPQMRLLLESMRKFRLNAPKPPEPPERQGMDI